MRNNLQWKLVMAMGVLLLGAGTLLAEVEKQVMPRERRARIVATAKALFEPQVKNSLKVGKVNSPFSSSVGE